MQGTSDASVITATALTALMSYAPTLTVAQAENLLVTTAPAGHLNVAGAFEAAGLGSIVAAGNAAIPAEPAAAPAAAPSKARIPPRKGRRVRKHRKGKKKKNKKKGRGKKQPQKKNGTRQGKGN